MIIWGISLQIYNRHEISDLVQMDMNLMYMAEHMPCHMTQQYPMTWIKSTVLSIIILVFAHGIPEAESEP